MKSRQMLLSLIALAIVFGGLAYADPRVRDRFTQLLSGGDGIVLGQPPRDLGGSNSRSDPLSEYGERSTRDLCRRRRRASFSS